jgi:phage protein U
MGVRYDRAERVGGMSPLAGRKSKSMTLYEFILMYTLLLFIGLWVFVNLNADKKNNKNNGAPRI